MTPEARANELFKPGGFCACDEWGSFHLEGCYFGQIGRQVAAEIQAAIEERDREWQQWLEGEGK